MPQQEYIKHLYEKEDFSVNKISQAMGINWRTANKYAKNEDWNKNVRPKQKRRRPVMESFSETVDVWILEDQLLPRKERRPATAMWRRLREKHGFAGFDKNSKGLCIRTQKRT